jgi:hypothetical protein
MKIQQSVTFALLTCVGLVAAPVRASGIALFDRLAGTWDVTYEIYDKDGTMRPYHGQVIYSRILGGGAL